MKLAIQFSHGNGFPAPTYQTLFDYLAPYEIRYVRRFGHDDRAHYPLRDWNPLVNQLLDSMNAHPSNVFCVGLGHSVGAAITLAAYFRRPRAFQHLILMEPPFFHPIKRACIRMASHLGLTQYIIPPARKTIRRRAYWHSTQEAKQSLQRKAFFKKFHKKAFDDYIREGFTQYQNQIKLVFSKQIEYQIYKTLPFALQTAPIRIPCDYLYSTQYEVASRTDIRYLSKRLSNVRFIPFHGSHMFPMEKPEQTANCIKHLLDDKRRKTI